MRAIPSPRPAFDAGGLIPPGPVRTNGRGGTTAVFVAAATAGVVLSAVVASGPGLRVARWSLLGVIGAWSGCWVVAVIAALRLPRRRALVLILGAGLAMRVAALAGPASTSDDLFRYSWDGRVQAQGIDPYAQVPNSPQLSSLRDPWLWPDPAGCAAMGRTPGCTRINRPAVRTIYPPTAEGWFAAVYRVAGIRSRHKAWQGAGLLTEVGVLALLPLAIKRHGRDPRWVALYALCPAPVVELVNNGHVDGLAILVMVAALVVVAAPTVGRARLGPVARDLASGALVGVAAGVKLYPAILLLALVGVARPRQVASWVRSTVTALAVVALEYLPHVLAVGWRVLGYLPGYLREEKYAGGGRFLVAGALRVPIDLAGPVSALVFLSVVAFVVWRRPQVPHAACILLGSLLLVTSPVQPWYAVSLLALATVAACPSWAVIVVAGYPYFWAVILNKGHTAGIGQVAYGLATATMIVAAVVVRRTGFSRPDQSRTVWAREAVAAPPVPTRPGRHRVGQDARHGPTPSPSNRGGP